MKFSIQTNGYFICQEKNFAADSECHYRCRAGWVAGNAITMTCNAKTNANDEIIAYNWDKDKSSFDCVKSIRYINLL